MGETSELGTCDQSFEITREWIATDACGNAATLTQNVLVEDNTPPLFCDDFCDEDFVDESYYHVECDSATAQPDPLVSDSCDDDVEVVADDPEEIDADFIDCANDKRIVYGWTTIDIEDTSPPECTNCDQLCYPLAGYGPTETEYAVYHHPENLIVAEDNCGDINSVVLLSCNSTQPSTWEDDNQGQPFDDSDCVFIESSNKLYVHMAIADPSDHCGLENIVSRAIWIPATSFAYHRAVDRDQCLNGLSETEFVQGLPDQLG